MADIKNILDTLLEETYPGASGPRPPRAVPIDISAVGEPVAPMPQAVPIPQPKPDPNARAVPIDISAIGEPVTPTAEPFLGGALVRGWNRAQQAANLAGGMTGYYTPEEMAKNLAANEYDLKQAPPSKAVEEGMKEINASEGFLPSLAAIARNPSAVLSTVGESLPMSIPSIVGAAGGALSPVPGGAMLGAGLGSGAVEYASSILDFLQEKGIDPSNEKAMVKAFNDEKLMGEAKEYSIKRGVPVGVFDALTLGVSSKIGASALAKSLSKTKRVGAAGAGVATEAVGGASGEAAAELATKGEIEWPQVLMEGVGEIIPGAGEMATSMRKPKPEAQTQAPAGRQEPPALGETTADRAIPRGQIVDPGPMYGQTVKIDPDQTGVATGMVKVILPDGTPHVLGEALVEPLGDIRGTGQDTVAPKETSATPAPEVSPNPSQSVTPSQNEGESGTKVDESGTKETVVDIDEVVPEKRSKPKVETIEEVAILRKAGYTDEQIAGMSRGVVEYEVDEADENGVRITPDDVAKAQDFFREYDPITEESIAESVKPKEAAPETSATESDGTREKPVKVETPEDIAKAEEKVAEEPTPGQKEAGNYQHGHVNVGGLDIAIETKKGGTRTGQDQNGNEWSVEMPTTYGRIKRTEGADGEQVDVYIGEDPKSEAVFVVDQLDAETKAFDEHKVMMGYPQGEDGRSRAEADYNAAFSDGKGKDRIGSVTETDVATLKEWLKSGKPKVQFSDWMKDRQTAVPEQERAPKPAAKEEQAQTIEPEEGETLISRDKVGSKGEIAVMEKNGVRYTRRPGSADRHYNQGGEETIVPEGSGPNPDLEIRIMKTPEGKFIVQVNHSGSGGPLTDASSAKYDTREQAIKEGAYRGRKSFAKMRRMDDLNRPNPKRLKAVQKLLNELDPGIPVEDSADSAPATKSEKPPVSSTAPKTEAPSAFGNNKIFTEDKVKAARERLKNKLKNQASSGFDPEIMMDGLIIAGAYIESGVRKFSDYAKAMIDDLGDGVKPYLLSFYEGARNYPGMNAEGMDSVEDAKKAFDNLSKNPETEQTDKPNSVTDQPNSVTEIDPLLAALRDELINPDGGFKTILAARKFLKDRGWNPVNEEVANKEAEEFIEAAIVLAARDIVESGKKRGTGVVYDRLVGLYQRQPRLSSRTSQSVANQAYSTPVPLAYVASRLAGVTQSDGVYEPTAGNGALLIEADPNQGVAVNELNPDRAAFLKKQGFEQTTIADAMSIDTPGVKVIIANPPFGAVREGGDSKVFDIDGYRTTAIDQAIAMHTLKDLPADGRAVFIVGSVKEGTQEERSGYYSSSQKRKFYKRLYDNYNVTRHFTVKGDLYERQGAGWPVDVIVIEGKGASALSLPAASVPPVVGSWEELKGYLDEGQQNEVQKEDKSGSGEGVQDREPLQDAGSTGGRSGGSAGGRGTSNDGRGDRSNPEPDMDLEPDSTPSDRGERTSDRADVDDGSRQSDGSRDGGRTDNVPPSEPGKPRITDAKTSESGQVPYRPYSREGVALNTLVPPALRSAMERSLAKIEKKHGSIDAFVAKNLKYDPSTLSKYFSAEQIDAIALAIDNIGKGDAFIIGDQTGIGKGRVVAAMIRYAHIRGWTPIFATEKPGLYGDMFRDLKDIGWPDYLGRDIDFFMTNANELVPLDDEAIEWVAERDEARANDDPIPEKRGTFMPKQNVKQAESKMRSIIAGKTKPDVIFTTYDQANSVKGAETPRRAFMDRMAPRSFLIMDESHNAGGQGAAANSRRKAGSPPPRSQKFREWVSAARAVMYSSATYAKNPNVMDLYSRTDMAKAVDDPKDLAELITGGGVPMQQIIAAMLAESGQYVRRERSFDGVSYDMELVSVDTGSYESFAKSIQRIFSFDLEVQDIKEEWISRWLLENGAALGIDPSLGEQAANSTQFSSIMHNVINQMTLAIKADAAADQAVAALKNGEKPVITLSFTSESFISDFAEATNTKINNEIEINFGAVLKRYLERTLRMSIRDSEDNVTHISMPLTELPSSMLKEYQDIMDFVDTAEVSKLPASPIDWIRKRITDAGFSVREITGRKTMLQYGNNVGAPLYVNRPKGELGSSGKAVTIKNFNSGALDSIILNKSGSTGVSLHASEKFKDQKKRRMIILQADGNIDTHMQTLGRVHRSGQVTLPAYTQLTANVPAEVRPTAVLMKKMASLSANTTASRKSNFTADSVDFMNVYGDMAAVMWAHDHPELSRKMGYPIMFEDNGKPIGENHIAKLTGRIMLLDVEEQERMLDELTKTYTTIVEQKDAAGENVLEAKTIDLQAVSLGQQEIKASTGTSPFEASVVMEKVSAKTAGRAMPPQEVIQTLAASLKNGDTINFSDSFAKNLRIMQAAGNKVAESTIAKWSDETKKYIDWAKNAFKKDEAKATFASRTEDNLFRFKGLVNDLSPGAHVELTTIGENPATIEGVVMEVEKNSSKTENPTALSGWDAVISVPDMKRTMIIPLSQLYSARDDSTNAQSGYRVIARRHYNDGPLNELENKFIEASTVGQEERYIATGNLVSAFDELRGRGQIIQYTTDKGDVKAGIIMSKLFDFDEWKADRKHKFKTPDQILRFLAESEDKTVSDQSGNLSIEYSYRGYDFTVPASRARGGVFYADSEVRAIYDYWTKQGSNMKALIRNKEDARKLIAVMQKLGAKYIAPTQPELADQIINGKSGDVQARIANPEAQAHLGKNVESDISLEALQSRAPDATEIVRRVAGDVKLVLFDHIKLKLSPAALAGWGLPSTSDEVLVGGYYDPSPDVVAVALGMSDYDQIAYHESFHRLQRLFLTQKEKDLLIREKERLRAIVAKMPGRKNDAPKMSQSELEAESFSWFASQKDLYAMSGLHAGIRRVWMRLAAFVRKVQNWLRQEGFQSYDDVFETAYSGDMAQRPKNPTPGPVSYSVDSQQDPSDPVYSIPSEATERQVAIQLSEMKESRVDKVRGYMQDRALPLRRLREKIELELGEKLEESLDTYLAEALYSGRVGERLIDLREKSVQPLVDKMREFRISVDELGEYLYARFAPVRNDSIRRIDPENNSGSGMTDDEAAAIIAATGSRQPQFDELARMVDRITKETRRRLHNAELITDEELDAWESSPYYVPMRGWETNPETASSVGGGRGFDVRGPESHVALGRRSKADNPLYYTILQAQQSIIRSEKSKVLKTLIRTAQTHPDPEMWSINKAEIRRRINPKTGLVESYAVPPQYRHADNLFRTRIGGKTYWLEIHHEPTARAMRNVGAVDKTNLFLKSGFFLSRTFAALQTQWVPEFVISNAIRDLETAMINITDVDERPNAIRRKMIADAVTLKSVRAIMHGLRNDSPTSEYAKYFEEFRLAGGKMAMVDFQTIDQIRDRLQADVKGRNKVGRGIMWALEAIGDVNTAFENGVRLSTYIALRKHGVSKAKSAFIARELTVNFSRRGTASPYINMAYIFFNAATQGTFRLGQALYKSKKVRMAYAGIFMFGVLVDQLNSMLAPDDDDEGQNPYDSIPDWERERNLILMVPGTSEYVKIPIAYGYNAPFFMGQQLSQVIRGKRKPMQAGYHSASVFVDAFNPIGTAPSFLQFITPTLLDPVAQSIENKKWYGGPIRPKAYDKNKPQSEQYFDSASKWSVDLAKAMNAYSGGNVGRSGLVDMSPNDIEHYLEFSLGGTGKFVLNGIATGESFVTGEEVRTEKIPFIRRLYGSGDSVTAVKRDFYSSFDEVQAARYEVKALIKAGERDEASKMRRKYAAELRSYTFMEHTRDLLTKLRQERYRTQNDEKLSRAERLARVSMLEEKEKEAARRATAAYAKIRKKMNEN